MPTTNDIQSIITLIIFIYALYLVPKAIGECKGIYMEKPDEFFGKFEADCKWTHGTTYALGAVSYIIIIPLLLLLWNTISNYLGILIANITLIILLVIIKIFYDKKRIINTELAYKKNIEDGYIKESEPMPSTKGRLGKIFQHIKEK